MCVESSQYAFVFYAQALKVYSHIDRELLADVVMVIRKS